MTDKRSPLLGEAIQFVDKNTKEEAIATALAHYIEGHRQKSQIRFEWPKLRLGISTIGDRIDALWVVSLVSLLEFDSREGPFVTRTQIRGDVSNGS